MTNTTTATKSETVETIHAAYAVAREALSNCFMPGKEMARATSRVISLRQQAARLGVSL